MSRPVAFAEELASLRGLLSDASPGIHLLEFATIPQLELILADIRPLCAERDCIEIEYNPARDAPSELVERAALRISAKSKNGLPLLILRLDALPDVATQRFVSAAFWKDMNFRREALGALDAQIILCVDPWHHALLIDEALDLMSWIMPKFRLITPPESAARHTQMYSGNLAFVRIPVSAQAARARWETFWPIVKKKSSKGQLHASSIRRYILPLLESTLATGNLVQARKVLDAAVGTRIPAEDLVRWYELNSILAGSTGDLSLAEDHAKQLLKLVETSSDEKQRFAAATALTEVANFIMEMGGAQFADSMHRHLLSYSSAAFGNESFYFLASRSNLANAEYESGNYKEAEKKYRDVLSALVRIVGIEHTHTLNCRNNLANLLNEVGKSAEAESEHRAVLAVREKTLGAQHSYTLDSRNNLANSLRSQGKHEEAEREHRKVLAIRTRELASEHPDVLVSRGNLAVALLGQGKFAEAEQEMRKVLEIRERIHGTDHPDVFKSCYALSAVLDDFGKTEEALIYARRAYQGLSKILGESHFQTQSALELVKHLESL